MASVLQPGEVTRAAIEARHVRETSSIAAHLRRVDWLLAIAVVAVVAIGLDSIAIGTRHDVPHDPTYYLSRQEVNFAVGLLAATVLMLIDPAVWRRLQWPLYSVTIGLIAAVLVVGQSIRGSQRWIRLPSGFQLQPSELGKLAIVLGLAAFIVDRRDRISTWRLTAAVVAYVGVASLLVYKEPDFGTAIVYAVSMLAVLFMAGTRWTHFAALLLIAVTAGAMVFTVLPGAGIQLVRGYQLDRLTAFLHPNHDPQGQGYNQLQSQIAVGSGSIAGRASTSTQTTYDFLPEHHTDFVFSVYGERYGFIGGALLLGLYLVILWRALRAAAISSTLYGSLVAAGIAGWFLSSIFINVGMTIGIAPITGIPLPFVSYGGSSMITSMAAVGVLQAIQLRGRRSSREGSPSARRRRRPRA